MPAKNKTKNRDSGAGFTPLEMNHCAANRRPPKGSLSLTGFMLFEVILSVFIVTIGVVFVTGSFVTSIKAAKASRAYIEALYLLEQRLWEYEEKGRIEDGRDSGKFEKNKDAEWEMEAKELEDISLEDTTTEVTITKDGQKRCLKVSTYFYKAD